MSGRKLRSGGKREGAGRKPLPPEQLSDGTYVTDIKCNKEYENIEDTIDDLQFCKDNDLPLPKEFSTLIYAKNAWKECIELDKNSKYHLLNDRHKEALKSYCLAVELRQQLIKELERLDNSMTIITKNGEIKINPVVTEISRLNDKINNYADALGLTVLSEFKMANIADKGKRLVEGQEKEQEESLFD